MVKSLQAFTQQVYMKRSRILALTRMGLAICAVLTFSYGCSDRNSSAPEEKPVWEVHFDQAMSALKAKNMDEWDRQAKLVFEEGNRGKMPPQAAMDPEQRKMEQMFWWFPMQDRGETKLYTEALRDLASYYEEQEKFADAERFHRKALDLERAEERNNPKARIRSNTSFLISFLQRRGKIKEALELQKGEIEAAEREAEKWPDQQRKAAVLMTKARAFEIEGKFDKVEDCLNKRVAVYADELSEENLAKLRKANAHANVRESYRTGMFTIDKLNSLQEFYERRKDLAGQERTLQRILEIHQKILPANCDLLTYDWDHLADVYRKQKDYAKEANALEKRVHYYETASGWEALSRAYEKIGKYSEGANALKNCIRLREANNENEDAFWTAHRYTSCANMLEKAGKKEEATQMREQAKKFAQVE